MNHKASCIFCKICDGTAPSKTIFKDEKYIAFACRTKAAKHHFLVCPIEHIEDAKALIPGQDVMVEEMYRIGKEILNKEGENLDDARFGFHWPPFHSISHLHLHAICPVSDLNFIHRLFYKPNSLWFVSPEYVISRLNDSKITEEQ